MPSARDLADNEYPCVLCLCVCVCVPVHRSNFNALVRLRTSGVPYKMLISQTESRGAGVIALEDIPAETPFAECECDTHTHAHIHARTRARALSHTHIRTHARHTRAFYNSSTYLCLCVCVSLFACHRRRREGPRVTRGELHRYRACTAPSVHGLAS